MRSKFVLIGLGVLAAVAIACGIDSNDPDSPDPGGRTVGGVTTPATPTSPASTPLDVGQRGDLRHGDQTGLSHVSPPAARLVIPDDLVGMNAALAEERLMEIGFTNIAFASADPDDTLVLYPPNWHVVKVEPAPGTELLPDSTIILTCSKQ